MARIPAFQAGCVGSIPITRSKKDDYIVIVFLVIFALRWVLLLCSDIRLSAEWYCLTAVKEANIISLCQRRNITFAKAKISRRTEWGISLKIMKIQLLVNEKLTSNSGRAVASPDGQRRVKSEERIVKRSRCFARIKIYIQWSRAVACCRRGNQRVYNN